MKWRLFGLIMLLIFGVAVIVSAQSADTPDESCILTPTQGFANVRAAPDINGQVVGTIPSGTTGVGLAQTTDNSGSIWYFLDEGWVSTSAVESSDACADLYTITPLTEAPRQKVTFIFEMGVSEGDADSYTEQVAIFGNSPRVPAVVVDSVTINEGGDNGDVICEQDACGILTLFLFTPIPSTGGGLFPEPITPSAPRTPVPNSSAPNNLSGYTAPLDCLPLGQVCLVALLRAPSPDSELCPSADFDQRLSLATETPRTTVLLPLTEVLREAGLRSLNGRRIETRFAETLGEDDPCELELLLPVGEPGAERFSLVDGGLQANFDVIRVTPPSAE